MSFPSAENVNETTVYVKQIRQFLHCPHTVQTYKLIDNPDQVN